MIILLFLSSCSSEGEFEDSEFIGEFTTSPIEVERTIYNNVWRTKIGRCYYVSAVWNEEHTVRFIEQYFSESVLQFDSREPWSGKWEKGPYTDTDSSWGVPGNYRNCLEQLPEEEKIKIAALLEAENVWIDQLHGNSLLVFSLEKNMLHGISLTSVHP